jgi:hypothetical protein
MLEPYIAEVEPRKRLPEKMFQILAKSLGVEAAWGGFQDLPENVFAKTAENQVTYFNGNKLDLPDYLIQRILVHEVQHQLNQRVWGSTMDSPSTWAFVFHPKFDDLYSRMKGFYDEKEESGYPFKKNFWGRSENWGEELSRRGQCYTHFDEVLALLRGYELFVEQQKKGILMETYPFEFIEAFCEEDLMFLDLGVREQLYEEMLRDAPEKLEA